jgi:FixJ family two-component response regulator
MSREIVIVDDHEAVRDVDGADFLVRLSSSRDAATVPVIVVSAIGHLLTGLRQADVRAAGVAEVLAKPVTYLRLIDAVRRVIGPP